MFIVFQDYRFMLRLTCHCVLVCLILPCAAEDLSAQSTPDAPVVSKSTDSEIDSKATQADADEYFRLFSGLADAIAQVEENYVKPIEREKIFSAAIRGIMRDLDPYSNYIDAKELNDFRDDVEGEFGGVGMQVTERNGWLTVISPLVGTPAYEAGIQSGDQIVEIDGESTEGMSLAETVSRMKGPQGSKVRFTIHRPGKQKPIEKEITRARIHVSTVLGWNRAADDRWNFLLRGEPLVGYIRLDSFSRDTPTEIRQALEKLKAAGMQGLVLDLRFNPGGLLETAVEVADMFVSEGLIVATDGRNIQRREWKAQASQTVTDVPLAVLVNRYSASASEVVSACLQDHERAVVIGERTWGKGSVQNIVELEDGQGALKLTTASYHRPSGKNIHRFPDASDEDEWGVVPNEGYGLRLSLRELGRLMEMFRDRDIISSSNRARANTIPNDLRQLGEDQQLRKALQYLKETIASSSEKRRAG